jgi:hypothetical protein
MPHWLLTVVTYPVTWLLATWGGGVAGVAAGRFARFGAIGFINGLVGVALTIAALGWLGRDPRWMCAIVVGSFVANDLHRASRAREASRQSPSAITLSALRFEQRNAAGDFLGGCVTWLALSLFH